MSYSCFVCQKLVQDGMRGLFQHLRSVHFICEMRGVILRCGQGDCIRCYTSFNSLAHHLKKEHFDPPSSSGIEVDMDTEDRADNSTGHAHSTMDFPKIDNPIVTHDSSVAAASFVSSLITSSSVTQKTVQSVVEHTSALIGDVVDDIKSDVVKILKATQFWDTSECKSLLNRIEQKSELFEPVNTVKKRHRFFRTKYCMVEATSVFLGIRHEQCLDTATGRMRPIVKRNTFQYVPILKLLGLLLSDDSIRKQCMKECVSSTGEMKDFCDGELYKLNGLFIEDKTALQLCLYYDECEVVNPLGSRRGIHKIGFIYLSLRNVDSMFNSRLNNIHIVAAFNNLDRGLYGFEKILAPIVADLKLLEQGVDLKLADGSTLFKRGTVALIAGDNLGLNQIGGFVESFSAIHFCRFCMADKTKCGSDCIEDSRLVRTVEQYEQQVKGVLEGSSVTRDCGLKSSCLLNELQYFHIITNASVDVMHDFLEGIVPYELKLILWSFIFDKKYFSTEVLNARLASFDYGCSDRKNKPTTFTESELRDQQKTTLNQKASQMFCLVSVLPFIVGDKVPESDEMWHLYLLLRDLIDVVFADTCTVDDSIRLKHLIEDHHTLFMSVFPDKHLLPKHHILVHYPRIMRNVGPLSKCSSMRFEAKHNESKRLCGIVGCFKDICKTVVKRHQISQCVRIKAGNLAVYEVSAQQVQVTTVNSLQDADTILSSIAGVQRFDDVSHTSCVSVCGTEYRKNMILVVDFDDEPVFCKIVTALIIADNIVYFVCNDLHVRFYDCHMHAYVVEQMLTKRVVEHSKLKYFKPLNVRHSFNSSSEYVVFN